MDALRAPQARYSFKIDLRKSKALRPFGLSSLFMPSYLFASKMFFVFTDDRLVVGLVVGPEVVLGNATALMGTTVAVCGSLKVIAEIVACIVGALFTVGCLFKILENAGIAVLKLVLKVMELAVETVPVITVAVAVVLEFVETGTAPLAEAIGGMVAVIDVGVEIALSLHVGKYPAGGSITETHIFGEILVDGALVAGIGLCDGCYRNCGCQHTDCKNCGQYADKLFQNNYSSVFVS